MSTINKSRQHSTRATRLRLSNGTATSLCCAGINAGAPRMSTNQRRVPAQMIKEGPASGARARVRKAGTLWDEPTGVVVVVGSLASWQDGLGRVGGGDSLGNGSKTGRIGRHKGRRQQQQVRHREQAEEGCKPGRSGGRSGCHVRWVFQSMVIGEALG